MTHICVHNPCYYCKLHSEDTGCLQYLPRSNDCNKTLARRTCKLALCWSGWPNLQQAGVAPTPGRWHDPYYLPKDLGNSPKQKAKQNTVETSTKNSFPGRKKLPRVSQVSICLSELWGLNAIPRETSGEKKQLSHNSTRVKKKSHAICSL